MLLLFAFNLVLNTGHLSYPTIDDYQLLFMLLFLSVDYPPQLNHFLYGFRYSHYLFLPQVFSNHAKDNFATNTPDKFGVVVSDVDFLHNTGHDFIIIIAALAVLMVCKIVELVFRKVAHCRSNRVGEDSSEQSSKS
jgi:hypothetical protein